MRLPLRCSRPAALLWLALALGGAPTRGAAQPADPPAPRGTDRPAAPRGASVRALTQYVHRAWTTEDGLPYPGVWAITRTRDGYLWVGSRGGLTRFDGARFVTFDTRNTPALRSSAVTSLYEGPDGTLWAGTLGGLARYREGRFTFYTTADGLPGDNVWTVDGAPDGTLWVGTLGGLARYREGRFATYTVADGLLTDDVRAVSVAPDGAVWVGTYGGGVNRLAGGRWTAYPLVDSPAGALVHRLLAGRDGRVWVGVGQGQADRSPHQLLRFDGGRFVPVAPEVPLVSVRALQEGADGALWVATYGGGLFRYAGGAFEPFTTREGLTDDRAQALYEDPGGNLWVGTMGGLDLLRRDAPFTTYATEEGLPNDNVRAVTADAAGTVWVATASGLARLDAGGVTAFTGRDGLRDPYVHALWARRNGEVWLGGTHAVTRYAGGVFTRFALPEAWPREAIWSVVEDGGGQIWLGSVGGGLVKFSPDSARAYTTADGLAHNSVTALLAGRAGRLWVGTSRGLGLMEGGRLRPFAGQTRFDGLNVRSLHEDADGTLWVGTFGRGLMRLRGGRVAVYTVREGLHDDGVWSILDDGRGALWMSCDRGVFRVTRADLEAVAAGRQRLLAPVAYGVADGMKSAEGNGASKPSGWRTRDGRLWFATQRGVVVVDPAVAARAAPVPTVEGVRTRAGDAAPEADGTFALPASARDLTIAYTSLSFADPERLRFRYRLDGFSEGWVDAGARREAVFTNVPAGRYRFRVAALGGSGSWSADADALVLTVAPFVWETAWFRVLAALAAAGFVALAVHAQSRRQRRRADALEALVAARTGELRRAKETTEAQALRLLELDGLRSRLFANVSHEFRTPLTLTLGPLDDLAAGLYGPLPAPMAEQVALARRNAGRVLDLINQILDVARLESGRMPLRAHALDFGAFVTDVAGAFRPAAERKGLAFDLHTPAAPAVVYADPAQLEKVVANLLSNAVKFTPGGGAVRVRVTADADAVQLSVRDDGPGIAPADLPRVFERFYRGEAADGLHQPGTGIGLALAREVVDLHGGTLSAESEEGFGSQFTVTLRRSHDHLRPDQLADQLAADPEARPAPTDDGAASTAYDAPGERADGELAHEDAAGEDAAGEDVTTVLVVDDHPDVRAYVRRHLAGHYRVEEAADGAAGLAKARALLPDLVVSDVMMPGIDGLALCRALKADPETSFIPIVLLTAKAAPEDRLGGLTEHADDYLTKPFAPAELRARIANLIASRQRLRERYRQEGVALVLGDEAGPSPALHAAPVDVPSADAVFLGRVRDAVEAHLGDEAFSVERLAEIVGVSRSQLHRRLRDALGQSPSDALRAMRLERGAGLLAAGAGTVSEVAYAVGFKSVAHFSNAFTARYGCRPSAYPPAV